MIKFIHLHIKDSNKKVRVRAEEIEHDLKGYKFFIHQTFVNDRFSSNSHTVTEFETGASVCDGDTKEACLKTFYAKVKKHGQKGFDKSINSLKLELTKQNTIFKKALNESTITLTESEERDLLFSLKKYGLIDYDKAIQTG